MMTVLNKTVLPVYQMGDSGASLLAYSILSWPSQPLIPIKLPSAQPIVMTIALVYPI